MKFQKENNIVEFLKASYEDLFHSTDASYHAYVTLYKVCKQPGNLLIKKHLSEKSARWFTLMEQLIRPSLLWTLRTLSNSWFRAASSDAI